MKKILNKINWKFNLGNLLVCGLFAAMYFIVKYVNPVFFEENGVVETMQIVILLVCFYLFLSIKEDKPLFNFAAMIIILLISREVNMGKPYVCQYYDIPFINCSWKHFKYGKIPNLLRLMFVAYMFFYACKTKIHHYVVKYWQKLPLYFWDILCLILAAVLSSIGERPLDNDVFEETAESIFYVALCVLIWRYKKIIRGVYK